jgi:hypothetical protein
MVGKSVWISTSPGARRARRARHLHQLREEPLGGAEVGAEERAVGVEHAHQREAGIVVALGEHLRADEDVDLAARTGRARLQRALARGGVAVDARDARRGSAAQRSSTRCVPWPTGRGRRAAVGHVAGTRSRRPQWWQRSSRSRRCSTRFALQRVQVECQAQARQKSTGAKAAAVDEHQRLLAAARRARIA